MDRQGELINPKSGRNHWLISRSTGKVLKLQNVYLNQRQTKIDFDRYVHHFFMNDFCTSKFT